MSQKAKFFYKSAVFLLLLFMIKAGAASARHDNLWLQIANSNAFPTAEPKHINHQYRWYKEQAFFAKSIAIGARPYLYHITEQLKQRNMPLELALLPIVESNYRMTVSSKGAAGIWQLMPSIAKHYNVPINDHYDGRFDLTLSTQAALDYLQDLYLTFNNNWLLAVAAYNCGESKIKAALEYNQKNNLSTEFWYLNVPQETRQYIPKFLALTQIVKTDSKFFPSIENHATTRNVDVQQAFSILSIAELIHIPSSEILNLNRAYIADKSAAEGPFHLLLPNQLATTLEQALLFTRFNSEDGYTVKKGDSLYRLAKLSNTSITKLRSLNRLKSNTIYIGQKLTLPAASPTMPNLIKEYAISPYIQRAKPMLEQLEVNYRVKEKDSLWHIATLFDVSVKELTSWNKIERHTVIKPGQNIKVLVTQSKRVSFASKQSSYVAHLIPKFYLPSSSTFNN